MSNEQQKPDDNQVAALGELEAYHQASSLETVFTQLLKLLSHKTVPQDNELKDRWKLVDQKKHPLF